MTFKILVEKTDGTKGTIECPNFNYVDPLNTLRQGVLKFGSLNKVDMALLLSGSFITIYRNKTQEFYGEITDTQKFSGGAIKVEFGGIEIGLAEDNGNYSSSPYTSTASATIASDIITEAPNWSNGTIEAGANIDFEIKESASYLNALGNLIKMTGQDIQFDDVDMEIDILDHRGSSTSVATLNDGIEITNTGYRNGRPIGNDVRVYGKSEGETRITSNFSTHGQNASSKSTYGTIVKPIIDRTILTSSQADDLADILVAKYALPTKIYTFQMIDFTLNIKTGDVVTIHSDELELNEELRVTAVERGLQNNKEFMSIEVTNKEYSETQIKQNQRQIQLEKEARESATHDNFQNEFTNKNCLSCVGGVGQVGTGAGGCSGDWLWFDGVNMTLGSGVMQAGILNINTSSIYNSICNGLIVYGNVENSDVPTLGCHLTNKTYVDACVAAAGSNVWADVTNPYIMPCNNCGICMVGDIVSATTANCIGIPYSPGAFKEFHGYCGIFSVCTYSPVIRGYYIYGATLVCGSDLCAIDDLFVGDNANIYGSMCVCENISAAAGVGTFGSINIGGSSACEFYVSGNGIFSGTLELTYANTTCACASSKFRLPVGTNCY